MTCTLCAVVDALLSSCREMVKLQLISVIAVFQVSHIEKNIHHSLPTVFMFNLLEHLYQRS